MPVQEAMGDAAYGGRRDPPGLRRCGPQVGSPGARPPRPRQRFPKDDFVIDLVAGSCTCPAGQVTHNIVPAGRRTDAAGRVHHLRAFQFDGSECMTCPLRSQCIPAKGRKGRWVLIHPQEALLQQARALQQSAGYDEYRARRVVVEHRLARLVHLGIRQSRYFRTSQDEIPAVPGGHGGQPDPGGGQGPACQAAPAAVAVSATPCAQRPSVPPLSSSPRSSVKSCPWPCVRRPHCRNSSHSSLRKRLSGPISRQHAQPSSRIRPPAA